MSAPNSAPEYPFLLLHSVEWLTVWSKCIAVASCSITVIGSLLTAAPSATVAMSVAAAWGLGLHTPRRSQQSSYSVPPKLKHVLGPRSNHVSHTSTWDDSVMC